MSMSEIRYVLVNGTNYYFDACDDWEKKSFQNARYNCGHWRVHPPKPVEFSMQAHNVKNASIAIVRMKGEFAYCVRGGLVRYLSAICSSQLFFTELYNTVGERIRDWKMVWKPPDTPILIVRGGIGSKVSYCEKCGWLQYYASDPNGYHVLNGQFEPYGVQLSSEGLLVTEAIADRMKEMNLKGISFSSVRVVDDPLDGFPKEIDLYKR